MQDMMPCPFCGNPKVKLAKKTHNYTSSYDGRCIKHVKYSVRCGTCYARGGLACGFVANYDNCEDDVSKLYRNKIATDKELQAKAIELWNERVEEWMPLNFLKSETGCADITTATSLALQQKAGSLAKLEKARK